VKLGGIRLREGGGEEITTCYNCQHVDGLRYIPKAHGPLCESCATKLGFLQEWKKGSAVHMPRARTGDVHVNATVGENTDIWRFASVHEGARIGERCTIGEAVHVGPRVVNGAQLFEGVTLEDDVFIGPGVVTTNVLTPRAFINRRAEFKKTLIKRGASIGSNATIICGVTIGEYAMVGAGSVVTKDVPTHALVVGNPARLTQYICKCGLPVLNPSSFVATDAYWYKRKLDCTCRACGEKYAYNDHRFIVGGEDAETT
jgi:UDP-2-acetamido-3-amino-2,3-dideoxy-glucuronate N-acetyltransferase